MKKINLLLAIALCLTAFSISGEAATKKSLRTRVRYLERELKKTNLELKTLREGLRKLSEVNNSLTRENNTFSTNLASANAEIGRLRDQQSTDKIITAELQKRLDERLPVLSFLERNVQYLGYGLIILFLVISIGLFYTISWVKRNTFIRPQLE